MVSFPHDSYMSRHDQRGCCQSYSLLAWLQARGSISIQPLVWRGSKAEAATLRLLGLEAAAEEAAEAAAAADRQRALLRARRTSSQKMGRSLPDHGDCPFVW